MASVLPLYTTPNRDDSTYDNAKVRRKSSVKVAIQAGIARGAGRRCCSCSIGKFLGVVLLVGIGYIAVTHTAPLQNAAKRTVHQEESGELNDSTEIWGKGVREGLLSNDVRGDKSNQSNYAPFNETDRGSDQLNMQEILWQNRQAEVVGAFRHAWKGYKDFAMGYDELKPIKKAGVDGLGGLGATIVDSLDTAIIMGCADIVQDAASWIEHELPRRLHEKGQVNLFETTIRVLGGLLSAFHLLGKDKIFASKIITDPKVFKETAIDLADRLYTAFSESPTPIPYSDVVLSQRSAHPAYHDGGASSTAEVATLQMEFWYLSKVSGDPKYGDAAMKVFKHIKGLHKEEGLVPIFISPITGQFIGQNIRLGSRGDSYYEYLVKVWLQQGGADDEGTSKVAYLRDMYEEAMAGVQKLLVRKSLPKGLVYVGELPSGIQGDFSPKMDHLVCFLAGTLAIGATRGLSKDQALKRGYMNEKDLEDLQLAEDLCHTCYQMYAVTATGLAPEIAYFNKNGEAQSGMDGGRQGAAYENDILIHAPDRHNLLRPETVESLFVLYRVTGEMKYRDWGWKIFEAFEAHTKVASGGYSSLDSVTVVPAPKRDKMETFFLGETLKYLYLLFSDPSVLPLDEYVFNTEAHPLPIYKQLGKLHQGQ